MFLVIYRQFFKILDLKFDTFEFILKEIIEISKFLLLLFRIQKNSESKENFGVLIERWTRVDF